MAINIFSGSSGPKGKNVNSASASARAQAAKNALSTPAETSKSGATAVGSKGALGKVGSFLGGAAKIAGKFLPGVGGIIANAAGDLLNDPEWWQSVPGDAVTLNEPLRIAEHAVSRDVVNAAGSPRTLYNPRAAILEVSSGCYGVNGSDENVSTVMRITELEATQYLMPEVRKVVNAITLQDAQYYAQAYESAASLYAIWRDLRKIDYMCKHGQTYIASMNSPSFPLFQTKNAAWLQATINRLEEYLRANVRIAHTTCEYLAWRFGRVYKSNASAKSALVVYTTLGLDCTPEQYDTAISQLMQMVAKNPSVQKANTDIYNAYIDHDYMVEVRDDTQFRYDMKEFMLRLNSQYRSGDCARTYTTGGDIEADLPPYLALDSSLDNPTVFMASTVSSHGIQAGEDACLFPVAGYRVYGVTPAQLGPDGPITNEILTGVYPVIVSNGPDAVQNAKDHSAGWYAAHPYNAPDTDPIKIETMWVAFNVRCFRAFTINPAGSAPTTAQYKEVMQQLIMNLMVCKSVDLYNVGIYVYLLYRGTNPSGIGGDPYNLDGTSASSTLSSMVDLTALSIDAATPTATTIGTEQIYAFANLVAMDRKHSMSYKQAEKLVARDTANLVESLDVASVAPSGTAAK